MPSLATSRWATLNHTSKSQTSGCKKTDNFKCFHSSWLPFFGRQRDSYSMLQMSNSRGIRWRDITRYTDHGWRKETLKSGRDGMRCCGACCGGNSGLFLPKDSGRQIEAGWFTLEEISKIVRRGKIMWKLERCPMQYFSPPQASSMWLYFGREIAALFLYLGWPQVNRVVFGALLQTPRSMRLVHHPMWLRTC